MPHIPYLDTMSKSEGTGNFAPLPDEAPGPRPRAAIEGSRPALAGSRGAAVLREELAALGVTAADVADAVAWARRKG